MKPIWALAMAITMSTTLVAALGALNTATTPRGAEIVAHGTSAGAFACARCYGFDGLSDGSGAFPILANQSADYLSKQLRDFASGMRLNAIMTPIAKALKDEEIEAAAQYYASVYATTVPPPARSPELVKRGEALATTGVTGGRRLSNSFVTAPPVSISP